MRHLWLYCDLKLEFLVALALLNYWILFLEMGLQIFSIVFKLLQLKIVSVIIFVGWIKESNPPYGCVGILEEVIVFTMSRVSKKCLNVILLSNEILNIYEEQKSRSKNKQFINLSKLHLALFLIAVDLKVMYFCPDCSIFLLELWKSEGFIIV